MPRTYWIPSLAIGLLVAVSACSSSTSPTPPASGTSNADGSMLKASAPIPQSPINGAKPPQGAPVQLVLTNSTTTYTNALALSYRFDVLAPGGSVVESTVVPSGSGTTSRTVAAVLNGNQTYQWRARAEYQGTAGPWSPMASFVAPDNDGYNKPGALFDPLVNGKTIGSIGGSGAVTFVPGQGLRMNNQLAYVVYELPQVFSSGEMSVEVTGLGPGGAPGKGRIFSILDRLGVPGSTAKYSINVQYRGAGGAPDNCIAWKAVLGDNSHSIEPNTDERYQSVVNLDPSRVYLFQAFWTPTSVRVVVKDGGTTGPTLYDHQETANSPTNWNPERMYAFLGTNNASYTGFDGTREGMTLRNFWVGSSPRPVNLGGAAGQLR